MPAKLFVQAQRFAEGLQRIFDMNGEGFGFAEERVRATVQALDATEHPWQFPMGIASYGAALAVSPAVGQLSIWFLRNPAQSRILVRMRRLVISNLTNADGEIGWGPIAFDSGFGPAGVARGTVRDTRQPHTSAGVPGVSASLFGTTTAAGAPGVEAERMFLKGPGASAQYAIVPIDYTIRPDTGFFVAGRVAQNGFTLAATWDEIPATATELNYPTVNPGGII